MNIKIANTILYCAKWAETVAFYRDVLSFPISFSNDWFVEFTINNGACLSVANQNRSSIQSAKGKGITLSFNVDDVEVMYGSLKISGVKPTPIKRLWGAWVFTIHDPEGNRIEFWTAE